MDSRKFIERTRSRSIPPTSSSSPIKSRVHSLFYFILSLRIAFQIHGQDLFVALIINTSKTYFAKWFNFSRMYMRGWLLFEFSPIHCAIWLLHYGDVLWFGWRKGGGRWWLIWRLFVQTPCAPNASFVDRTVFWLCKRHPTWDDWFNTFGVNRNEPKTASDWIDNIRDFSRTWKYKHLKRCQNGLCGCGTNTTWSTNVYVFTAKPKMNINIWIHFKILKFN